MSDEAKISFTVKTKSGDLFTVRGDSAEEFRKNIAELVGNPQTAQAMGVLFEEAQTVPPPYSAEQAVTEMMGGTPVVDTPTGYQPAYRPPWNDSAPPPQYPQSQQLPQSMTPPCENCGAPTTYEEWTGKKGASAGKLFKAYKCSRDRDHKTQWIN